MSLFASFGFLIISIPAFALMGTGVLPLIYFGLIMLAIVQSAANVVMTVMLVELYPPETRSTSSAIGYNVSSAFIAGPAAYIGAWLAATFQMAIAPAFYLVAVTIVTSIILFRMLPEPSKWDLHTNRPSWSEGNLHLLQVAEAKAARSGGEKDTAA